MVDLGDRATDIEPASPRRPSPSRWILVAATIALVVVIGALAADDEAEIDTTTPGPAPAGPPLPGPARSVLELTDFEDLEPGTYFIDPDGEDSTPLRVTYDVTEPGWSQWIGAVKFNGRDHVALSIITIDNLVREGCVDHRPADPPIGPTVDDLVVGLSQLAPFEVTSPATDVMIFGYEGKHLELTVPDMPTTPDRFTECTDDGQLHSWISKNGGGAFYGYNAEPGRTEEFWILDVGGTRLVLAITQSPSSSPQDVAEVEAILGSIRIEP